MKKGTGKPAQSENAKAGKRFRFKIHPGYVILVVLMALFAFKFIQKTEEVRSLARQEAALQYQNQVTAAQNASMQRAIRWYKTSQYVEEAARATLGYTMPGEVSVMVQPPSRQPVPVHHTAARYVAAPAPAWKQWWRAFFG